MRSINLFLTILCLQHYLVTGSNVRNRLSVRHMGMLYSTFDYIVLDGALGSVEFHELTIFNGSHQTAFGAYIKPNLNRTNLWIQDSSFVI